MIKTQYYNNLPPEVIKKFKLKPGQVVRYRLHNMRPAPMDPSRLAIPAILDIPLTDTIRIPGTDDFTDIAAIRSVSTKGKIQYHEIRFTAKELGYITLSGDNAAHQAIHTYLQLCNYNGSNPDRDPSKEIIFEFVDEEAKAEADQKVRNLKRQALNAAADMNEEEIRNFVAARGFDDTRPVKILRNEVEAFADQDPSGFLDILKNTQATSKAILNRAIKKGVIVFNKTQSRFEWPTGEVILVVARTTGQEPIEELAAFCEANVKGEKVFQTIQSKAKKG